MLQTKYNILWIILPLILILSVFIFYYYKKLKKYSQIIANTIITVSYDEQGIITEASSAFCELSGYEKDELIGRKSNIFSDEATDNILFSDMYRTVLSGNDWEGEIKSTKKNNSYYFADAKITAKTNSDGSIKSYSATYIDITAKKKLEKISMIDSLTEIPNSLFIDKIYKQEIERAKRHNRELSIILLEIDLFHNTLSNHGQKGGNKLIIEVAHLLKSNIRTIDTLGRWSGEKFVIICPETTIDQADMFAEKIRKIIKTFKFSMENSVTCSFGVSQYKREDKDEDIFKRIETALKTAKNGGKNMVITKK